MIYFYYGENDFMLKRHVATIAKEFAKKYGPDSVTRIDGGDVEIQRLMAEIVNVNLFSPQRLIVLSGLSGNKSVWAEFGENVGRIPVDTSVAIVDQSPDKRTRTFKELQKLAKLQEFKFLKGRELSSWVAGEIQDQKLECKGAAIEELILATSGDQWRIATEIAKLKAIDKVITVERIREFVEPDLESDAFAVFDQAVSGHRDRVASELANLKRTEDPNRFFGLLSSQVFALTAAIFADGQNQAASDLKIHPFQLSKMNDLARRIGDDNQQKRKIQKISETFAKTDAKLKLSRPDEAWVLIELALCSI